jgi:hypothetical protein
MYFKSAYNNMAAAPELLLHAQKSIKYILNLKVPLINFFSLRLNYLFR